MLTDFLPRSDRLAARTVVVMLLTAFACGDSTAPNHGIDERSLSLVASPQNRSLHVTWAAVASATGYSLSWSTGGQQLGRQSLSADALGATIGGLENHVSYRVDLAPLRIDGTQLGSVYASQSPRPRPDCTFVRYNQFIPALSAFCSFDAMDEWLKTSGIDPAELRCRGAPVRSWDANSPNCLYLAGLEQILLLRSADAVPNFAAIRPAASVRSMARRALWPDGDPAGSPHRFAIHASGALPGVVGAVTQHRGAASYTIRYHSSLSSRVTWFIPHNPVPGRYVIYHEGHGGSAVQVGARTIDWFLARGWQVVAMDMPVIGRNEIDATSAIRNHSDFVRLDAGRDSPVGLFFLPVKAVIDMISTRDNGDPFILMAGLSGGGFTSYLAGALDNRIDYVVSIAGGTPLSQRLAAPWTASELGDFEQFAPHLYDAVPHESLMIAAGSKGAFFLFNLHDPCCFRVDPGDPLVGHLIQAGAQMGKPIEVFIDETNGYHELGPDGLKALEGALTRLGL